MIKVTCELDDDIIQDLTTTASGDDVRDTSEADANEVMKAPTRSQAWHGVP